MINNRWVLEIYRLSEELGRASYHLNELQGVKISSKTRKKYRYFVNAEVLLRAIATYEIDSRYSHVPLSEFDEKLYVKVLNGRAVGEYLTFYWLWQILAEITGERRNAQEYKGIVLHFVWTHIGPLLRSLDLFDDFRLVAEKRTRSDYKNIMQSLLHALLSSLELALEFRWSSKQKGNKGPSGVIHKHMEIGFISFVLQHPKELARTRNSLDEFINKLYCQSK